MEAIEYTNDTVKALNYIGEMLRIQNLIAIANSTNEILNKQTSYDAAVALTEFHAHKSPLDGGWYELNAETAKLLRVMEDQIPLATASYSFDVDPPKRRLRECVEAWPDCATGDYNPSCCRWPKSCACTVYGPDEVTEDDLEAQR